VQRYKIILYLVLKSETVWYDKNIWVNHAEVVLYFAFTFKSIRDIIKCVNDVTIFKSYVILVLLKLLNFVLSIFNNAYERKYR